MTAYSERTVAAISTPAGEGGIGVIRISGSEAVEIADRCFKAFSGKRLAELKGYHAAYGQIISNGEALDDAVALVFHAPHSYTGEDTVELSVHGGRLMVKAVLRAVLAAGAALADRGEFSKRAYQNGKMDLAKAESIMGLISADNEAALKISREAKNGRISREINDLASAATALSAELAAYSDFPDEDIPELSAESFRAQLVSVSVSLSRLLANYDAGRVIREGISCAIVGKPNVGKSTLMNLLSGCERSIVTDIAGTTRDIIEEAVNVGGIALHLSDTAGIHAAADRVEQVGIERAKEKIKNAALILAVFDGSAPLAEEDKELLASLQGKTVICILNKADRGSKVSCNELSGFPTVLLSAKNGDGIEELSKQISEISHAAQLDPATAVLVNERQHKCAETAAKAIAEALAAMDSGCTLDAVAVCIDDALASLLELTGKRVTNEVADEVFRRFCIGK